MKTDLSNSELDELKKQSQNTYDSLTLTTNYKEAAKDEI